MLIVCYGAKGGCGTSVVAASLALASPGATLIDLDGDAADVLGLGPDIAATQGIAEWTRSEIGTDALSNLTHPVGDVSLLPRGHGPIADDPARWSLLTTWLAGNGPGVVDAGTGDPPVTLAQLAGELLLVTRPCYLALVRASRNATRPTGVVVIDEPGRALTLGDIERAVGAPVVARILLDPAVARAVDAGLLAHAVPRRLARHLRGVVGATSRPVVVNQ